MLGKWKGQQRATWLSRDLEISIINHEAFLEIRTTPQRVGRIFGIGGAALWASSGQRSAGALLQGKRASRFSSHEARWRAGAPDPEARLTQGMSTSYCFVQSPSTSRTSKLSRENSPRSLRHLPMTPQAVREKSKELDGKMPLLWEHLRFVSSTYSPWLLWFLIQAFSLSRHFCTVPPATQLKLQKEPPGHQIQMRKEKKDLINIQ